MQTADSQIAPHWRTLQMTWADAWIRGGLQLAIRAPLLSDGITILQRMKNWLPSGSVVLLGLLEVATMIMRRACTCRTQAMLQHSTTQRHVACEPYRAPFHIDHEHRPEPQFHYRPRQSFADFTLHMTLPGPNSRGRTPLVDANSSTCQLGRLRRRPGRH